MSDSSESTKTPITRFGLVRANSVMLALTTLFFLARATIHISHRKIFELGDFFICFAFALYVSLWICYIIMVGPMFKVSAVGRGEITPYPTLADDAAYTFRLIAASQMCFYTSLYCVKISLLILYRKLLVGLSTIYYRIWYGIIIFCILSWIGSVLSTIFSCDDLAAQFSQGKCGESPSEKQRIIFSLYFAYGVDVATDLAVMFLPLRLTYNLRLPRLQKAGIFVLFGSGMICILFATLRVVQLGVDAGGKAVVPEPKWMTLWTVVETSMAIIIGCSPTFVVLIRTRIGTRRSAGYVKQPGNLKNINLATILSKPLHSRHRSDTDADILWRDEGSEEALARGNNEWEINIPTAVQQERAFGP
ncbi:hypothetical protein BS50DRAFT_504047 [Corynespora cassiicola Philippines]|uniref:Rhodopsin domain-containing protein n=1 Tax=Corynespora cassiicola Philippines TaxID=1448308 RepID=A0A2T2N8I3_CORCC|nr:hypothetical protein BS50DRAFT_504047 [Corynespora cassiicola Philippines]